MKEAEISLEEAGRESKVIETSQMGLDFDISSHINEKKKIKKKGGLKYGMQKSLNGNSV